jgi:hypothetical protein
LAFGGSPDLNRNGIPDFIYAVASDAFVPNPAEPDADRDGIMDVWQQDSDRDGITDGDAYLDARARSFAAAGIDPQADADGDGTSNEIDEWLADFDADGIVNFNDATPCGSVAVDSRPESGGGGLSVIAPVPAEPAPRLAAASPPAMGRQPRNVPEPEASLQLADEGPLQLASETPPPPVVPPIVPPVVPEPADVPPKKMLVPDVEQPPVAFDIALLAAGAGDVDVDSDNTSPSGEPDHGVGEERLEDEGDGMVVSASGPDSRVTAPLDVLLRSVTPATRVRFRSATGAFAIYGGDPGKRSWVPQVLFDDEYRAVNSGFVAGRYRRFHVEVLRAGRDAITVEVDVDGDGSWTVVDGVVLTGREATDAGPRGTRRRPH